MTCAPLKIIIKAFNGKPFRNSYLSKMCQNVTIKLISAIAMKQLKPIIAF